MFRQYLSVTRRHSIKLRLYSNDENAAEMQMSRNNSILRGHEVNLTENLMAPLLSDAELGT